MDVTTRQTTRIGDIQLVLPMNRDVAVYMMGLGRQGGFRPLTHRWKWNKMLHQDSVWLGDVNAGLRCQWFDRNYQRPIIIEGQPTEMNLPPSWHNRGRGGVSVDEADDRVLLRAFSGSRTITTDQTLSFNFNLLITSFKTIDPDKHWKNRYYHESAHYPTPDFVTQAGVNVVNLHQGNDLNPYINYPFHTTNELTKYVKSMHNRNVGVKLYYTVRELSTRVYEMWALRSLDDEVFVPGLGGGHPWMLDHLGAGEGSGYVAAWTAVLPDGTLDTSITTTMLSRWHNYGKSWHGPKLLHGPMHPGTDTGSGDLKRRNDNTFVAATYYANQDSTMADVEQYTFGGERARMMIEVDHDGDGVPNASSAWYEVYNGRNVFCLSSLPAIRWRLKWHLSSTNTAGLLKIDRVKITPLNIGSNSG